jgi:hypothetical protein
VAPKADDRNEIEELEIPPFIVANKVNRDRAFDMKKHNV